MERVVVVGTSGAGKTTVARSIGAVLDAPVVELDSLRHLPGWEQRPEAEFINLVAEATSGDRWVVDGNYSEVRQMLWSRAQVVVWLDYPRWRVMGRIVPRTLARVATRHELWPGVSESWRNLLTLDPEDNVILWAWTTHGPRRCEYAELMAQPQWAHITFHRVTRPGDMDTVIESLRPGG